jgi:Uncharacterized protein conserved in bacteria
MSSTRTSVSTNQHCNRNHKHNHNLTLDLHGCTKLQAIEKLTFFLDQIRTRCHHDHNYNHNQRFVTIITGSGKHSSHGPVLRQAIQHVLEKRQMNFHLNDRGKGSFCVDALSGIDLVDRAMMRHVSTKIVTIREDEQQAEGVTLFPRDGLRMSQDATLDNPSNNGNDELLPTPGEVARDDDLIQRIKMLSHDEAIQIKSLQTKEENELQKAFEASAKIQEDMDLKRVLLLSKEQHELEQEEYIQHERILLSNALEMSLKLEQEREERDRIELERVLKLLEKESGSDNNVNVGEAEEEEDLDLLQVLECSKRQDGQRMDFEEQLKLALEESLLTL